MKNKIKLKENFVFPALLIQKGVKRWKKIRKPS